MINLNKNGQSGQQHVYLNYCYHSKKKKIMPAQYLPLEFARELCCNNLISWFKWKYLKGRELNSCVPKEIKPNGTRMWSHKNFWIKKYE